MTNTITQHLLSHMTWLYSVTTWPANVKTKAYENDMAVTKLLPWWQAGMVGVQWRAKAFRYQKLIFALHSCYIVNIYCMFGGGVRQATININVARA